MLGVRGDAASVSSLVFDTFNIKQSNFRFNGDDLKKAPTDDQ